MLSAMESLEHQCAQSWNMGYKGTQYGYREFPLGRGFARQLDHEIYSHGHLNESRQWVVVMVG